MRRERLDSIVRWCQGWQALSTRRVKGQIAVYMAVLLTSLMGLAGAGVDYGLIVIESSRLQNALDAASLAGARALVLSTAATQGAATNPAVGTRNYEGQQAANNFLISNGYTNGANGATFTFTPSASVTGASNDTMQVSGTVIKPTSFWKAIGINSTTLTQTATAVSTGGMVDVMLSLDLTGSMEMSGYADIAEPAERRRRVHRSDAARHDRHARHADGDRPLGRRELLLVARHQRLAQRRGGRQRPLHRHGQAGRAPPLASTSRPATTIRPS